MESIRTKLGWGLAMAVSLLLVASLAGVVQGGPLDPPAPPGSTGKNVITSLPFTISQPGSYVLNSNLTGVSGQNGINVTTNNVTVDLQGFELVGVSGSQYAIAHLNGSLSDITVRNGTIRNWGGLGISVGLGLLADGVVLKDNGGGVIASDGATLTNCRIEGSVGSAVILGSRAVVSKCTSDSNGSGCGTCPGIQVGADSSITEAIARNNGGNEIQAGANSTLENCTADGNATAGYGISVGEDSVVGHCIAKNNGSDEITAGDRSLIENCVADGWTGTAFGSGNGIVVANASTVRGCTATNNLGTGIYVAGGHNRVEGNHVRANNTFGINVPMASNVIVLNDAQFNGLDDCLDGGGNHFVRVARAGGAGAFDNLCGYLP